MVGFGCLEVFIMLDSVHLPDLVKQRLVESLEEWVSKNINVIGEKWSDKIRKEIRKFKKQRATIPRVAGFAMWCFCLINNLGVVSTIGEDGYAISESTWKRGFDRDSTKRLLFWCSEAVKLLRIPKEIAECFGWG